MKNYSYYLFDADGTLIDTTELIYQCFVHTCAMFGDIKLSRNDVVKNIGLTLRHQMERYFGILSDEQFGIRAAEHMRYQLSIYPKYLRVFPTVVKGLDMLRERGKRCAIVTSRKRETLDLYLKKTGIYDYFEVFVTPENTSKHKPEPEPALAALSMLGARDKGDAVFIGDSEYDIECGSRAGIDTILVAWTQNDPVTFSTQPAYSIDDLTLMLPDAV